MQTTQIKICPFSRYYENVTKLWIYAPLNSNRTRKFSHFKNVVTGSRFGAPPHLTLLEIFIHPDAKINYDSLLGSLGKIYDKLLDNIILNMKTQPDNVQTLGKYLTLCYNIEYKNTEMTFAIARSMMILELENQFGGPITTYDNGDFVIYSLGIQELFAIPIYAKKIEDIIIHISVLHTDKLTNKEIDKNELNILCNSMKQLDKTSFSGKIMKLLEWNM